MNKERLEELIEYFNGYGSPFDDLIIDLARRMGSLSLSHARLVAENIRLQEQAERVEELERKHEYALDDLEVFKRNYKEKRLESRRYKQALEELEETNKKNYWIAADFKFENLKLEQQNRRYKQALEDTKEFLERMEKGQSLERPHYVGYNLIEALNTINKALEGEE